MPEPLSAPEDARRAQERERLLTVLRGIAEQETKRLHAGRSSWAWWLDLASRHGRYGFANTLLINAQMPTATDVRSYRDWQAQGRQVRKGATGIRIISLRGNPRPMFDISQTDGPPVDTPQAPTPAEAWERLRRLAADRGLQIDRGGGWAYTGPPGRLISIAPELGERDAPIALAHQLGHIQLHGGPVDQAGEGRCGCHGAQRVEADSITHLLLAHLGLQPEGLTFPAVARWAGTDPRANPAAAIRNLADRVLRASGRLTRRLSALPPPNIQHDRHGRHPGAPPPTTSPRLSATDPERHKDDERPDLQVGVEELAELQRAAHDYFTARRAHSWVPAYLRERGFDDETQIQWGVGHAPKAWRGLTDHLRGLGHSDEAILASGLARRARNGRLYDTFRDRVMVPLRRPDGIIAGFIGRRPDGADGPKYLNSPDSPLFHKGELLFGLHETRGYLAAGARPVIVEGPFDAMAINTAAPQQYAAVAPSGTALTTAQIRALGHTANLHKTGLIIALDGDAAGQAATERAWKTLAHLHGPVEAVILPEGRDPADILRDQGPDALREALQQTTPLADLVIDAAITRAGRSLHSPEDRLAAARAAAAVIAHLPPAQVPHQVARVAELVRTDPATITQAVVEAIAPDAATARRLADDDFPLPPLASPPTHRHRPADRPRPASRRPTKHR
ncbi:toprim domain-containing protein [Thermomonospora cellulosilytica]|uniref:DNA primase n=1 Tax=Thermomonospora cellulosilytica TaxID=1411118 RepID=A0A7W3N4F3_9ACTN|nr:toprim domain-containing protein [Thermomonospora cellulosilytica]MBA9007278.1 DNA primase [Thermomonospora cellulosilytica]